MLEVLCILFLDSESEFEDGSNINARLPPKFPSVSRIPLELEISVRGNNFNKVARIFMPRVDMATRAELHVGNSNPPRAQRRRRCPAPLPSPAWPGASPRPTPASNAGRAVWPGRAWAPYRPQSKESTTQHRGWGVGGTTWQSSSKNKCCTS